MKRNPFLTVASLLMTTALILAACSSPTVVPTEAPGSTEAAPTVAATETAPTDVPTEAAPEATPEPVTVRLALLPVIDTLPVFVAIQEGYFEANGLIVETIPVASAAERDQLIASGGADGMLNDMVSTIIINKDTPTIVAVALARTATADYPQYRILASAQSGITDVEGLKGVEIGISEGSVIAYTTDRLLQAEGLAPEDIKTVAVPRIPDRLQLLGTGELQAANLPDPLSSLAIAGGAVVVVDDSAHPEYGFSVWSFRNEFIAQDPDVIGAFLTAVMQAAEDINNDKTKWDQLLTDQALLPQPLMGNYTLPDYPISDVPTEEQFNDVLAWTQEKGFVTTTVNYSDSVKEAWLP
jgi:NitT/TauT family transport system substrate-binding protein